MLASRFVDERAARQLVVAAGIRVGYVPWNTANPLVFWSEVSRLLEAGAASGGAVRLVALAQEVSRPGRASRDVAAPAPVSWLPALAGSEVERPELAEALVALLLAEDPTPVGLTAVHGGGGFGKTTLANLVCHREDLRDAYPDGIAWVVVGQDVGGVPLAEKVNGLAARLGGADPGPSDPGQAGMRLGELLADRRMLLVLDDVWTSEQLKPFLISGPRCRRVVTTRDRRVLPPHAPVLLVDTMSLTQARAVLIDAAPALDAAVADVVAERCGRWPVLLGLVAGHVRTRVRDGVAASVAAGEVMEGFDDEGVVAFDEMNLADESARSRAVEATVNASLRLLDRADEPGGPLLERYLELAVFEEDLAIVPAVLEVLWGHAAGWTAWRVRRFRDTLASLALVLPDAATADGRTVTAAPVRLHDVIHQYLRHRVYGRLPALHGRLLDAYRGRLPRDGDRVCWWALPDSPASDYLAAHLIDHLLAAGERGEARQVACDLRWVEATIRRTGSTLTAEHGLAAVGTDGALALAGALAQKAHLLPAALPGGLGSSLVVHLARAPGLGPAVSTYAASLPRPHLSVVWTTWPVDPAQRRVLTGHAGDVSALAFSPDGGLLASTDQDGSVRLWDLTTGAKRTDLTGHTDFINAVTFSPDGRCLATGDGQGTVRLWNVETGVEQALLPHPHSVSAMGFSPDGRLLATGDRDEAETGSIRLWEVATGAQKMLLTTYADVMAWAVTFSPEGQLLTADTSSDGTVTVRTWNVTTGDGRIVLVRRTESGGPAALSCDGRILAVADRLKVHLWDVEDGLQLPTLTGHTHAVTALVFSADSQLIATGAADETARVWEIGTGIQLTLVHEHSETVHAVALSPDAHLLATGTSSFFDGSVRLWTVAVRPDENASPIRPEWISAAAASPDGRLLAVAGNETLRLWDITAGTEPTVIPEQPESPEALGFTSDGRLLAASVVDIGTLYVWDAYAENHGDWLSGPTHSVSSTAFSRDGRLFAAGDEAGAVWLWTLTDPFEAAVLAGHTDVVSTVAFSPNGRLATGDYRGTLRFWDPTTGSKQAAIAGDGDGLVGTEFSPNGHLLATSSAAGMVQVRDAATGSILAALTGHSGPVRALAFSPDSRLLATGGTDRTVRVWDIAAGGIATALRVEEAVVALTWRNHFLCCATTRGALLLRVDR